MLSDHQVVYDPDDVVVRIVPAGLVTNVQIGNSGFSRKDGTLIVSRSDLYKDMVHLDRNGVVRANTADIIASAMNLVTLPNDWFHISQDSIDEFYQVIDNPSLKYCTRTNSFVESEVFYYSKEHNVCVSIKPDGEKFKDYYLVEKLYVIHDASKKDILHNFQIAHLKPKYVLTELFGHE